MHPILTRTMIQRLIQQILQRLKTPSLKKLSLTRLKFRRNLKFLQLLLKLIINCGQHLMTSKTAWKFRKWYLISLILVNVVEDLKHFSFVAKDIVNCTVLSLLTVWIVKKTIYMVIDHKKSFNSVKDKWIYGKDYSMMFK